MNERREKRAKEHVGGGLSIPVKPHLSIHEMSPAPFEAKYKQNLGNFSRGKAFTLRTDVQEINNQLLSWDIQGDRPVPLHYHTRKL